ncbi:uncharacterized protein LOC120172213 [Hibiscus syriacus]|uniref:uncharacterized protein LOC120172213 n=1 Tax=Hibiscus syriacus TaxID=106335 RepID=UPI00192126D4|nr:uncharacterized protein LOC120172213 [Hibiscus syriacus]
MTGANQGDGAEVIPGVNQLLPEEDKAWDWGPKCQSAFDEIKLAMISEPVLVLPDHTKPFKVFTDASDVAIGGVLCKRDIQLLIKLLLNPEEVVTKVGSLARVSYRVRFFLGTQTKEGKFFGRCIKPKEVLEGVVQVDGIKLELLDECLSTDVWEDQESECTRRDLLEALSYQFAKEWQEQHELARACLHKARKWTKKWADQKHQDVNFEVGDLFLAKLSGILHNLYHKGLVRRYEGPFKVLKRVGTIAYKLELPSTIKAHPMFHVSLLKLYYQDEEELDRGKSHRAPVGVKVSY